MANNYNQENKLIKIDGEYVKLYVTTNVTLPKLLKNTGSLIVYHEEENNNSLNYLYLGNELISSGWGLQSKCYRDKTQNIVDKFNNFVNILTKFPNGNLEDTSWWLNLDKDSFLYPYRVDFISSVIGNTGTGLSIPELFNELYTRILGNINTIKSDVITKDTDLSDKNNQLYITQYFNNSIVPSESGLKSKQIINMSELQYTLGAAQYYKPEITSHDIEIEYGYFDRTTHLFVNIQKAKKVNGKFQIPRGAFIINITLKIDAKLNDAYQIDKIKFDYLYTKYNKPLSSLSEENTSIESLMNYDSNSIFSDITSYAQSGTTFDNTTYIADVYEYFDSQLSIGSNTLSYIKKFNYQNKNKFLLVYDSCNLMKNIKLCYKGVQVENVKYYPGVENNLFNHDSLTSYLYSFENMFGDGEIDTNISVDIECVDICRNLIKLEQLNNTDLTLDINRITDYLGEINETVSTIYENKTRFYVGDSIKKLIPINKNLFSTFILIPINKVISKISLNIKDKFNNVRVENVTGILKNINNTFIMSSCSPTIKSLSNLNDVVYSISTDTTNVFSDPFKVYFFVYDTAQLNDEFYSKGIYIDSIDVEFDDISNTTSTATYASLKRGFGYYNFVTTINPDAQNTIFNSSSNLSVRLSYNNGQLSMINDDTYDGTHLYNLNINRLNDNYNAFLIKIVPTNYDQNIVPQAVLDYLEKINGESFI